MQRLAALLVFGIACGARTELYAEEPPDASTDAAIDHTPDVSPVDVRSIDVSPVDVTIEAPAPPCDFGNVVSDVFGKVVYWNGGAPLPAGHYRVTYVDGCMKYSSGQDWSVNAYDGAPDSYWLVTGAMTELAVPPGTVGFIQGSGGFASFDACVAANASDPAVDLDFPGGTLGVWLQDDPYSDNVPGVAGRNPTWHLSSCP